MDEDDITSVEEYEEMTEEKGECTKCGYFLAAVGLLVGSAFLYMALDVFSGGRITGLLFSRPTDGETE